MRSIIVIFALLLLMRYGSELPFTHTVLASGQESGTNIGTLAAGALIGGLPLLGIFYLFRAFFRWHRDFHGRMRAEGRRVFPRGRAR
jgi:hypothetical protein